MNPTRTADTLLASDVTGGHVFTDDEGMIHVQAGQLHFTLTVAGAEELVDRLDAHAANARTQGNRGPRRSKVIEVIERGVRTRVLEDDPAPDGRRRWVER